MMSQKKSDMVKLQETVTSHALEIKQLCDDLTQQSRRIQLLCYLLNMISFFVQKSGYPKTFLMILLKFQGRKFFVQIEMAEEEVFVFS